jgi:hypothetical protein
MTLMAPLLTFLCYAEEKKVRSLVKDHSLGRASPKIVSYAILLSRDSSGPWQRLFLVNFLS